MLWERAAPSWEVEAGRTEQTALLWHDLEADTAAVLETWDYWDGTGAIFGELVKHAIASDGRVATGSPADYCIRLSHAFEEGGRTGCRERSPVPVAAGFNDLSGLGDWGGEAFGFLTLDTGEIVVGRVDLTGSAVPPT